jgi:hypothetical protein
LGRKNALFAGSDAVALQGRADRGCRRCLKTIAARRFLFLSTTLWWPEEIVSPTHLLAKRPAKDVTTVIDSAFDRGPFW